MTLKCDKQGHTRMHPTCPLIDYAPQIPTIMTSLLTVVIWGQSDNCYQFKMFALLMYSRGVSPRIPSNLMMSRHPHGICLHSLILISQSVISLQVRQSVFSYQFRPPPCRLHKPRDMPCFLHSDSDQQKDNINHTQPLASSTCNINSTQPLASSAFKVSVHPSSMHIDPRIPHCLLLQ